MSDDQLSDNDMLLTFQFVSASDPHQPPLSNQHSCLQNIDQRFSTRLASCLKPIHPGNWLALAKHSTTAVQLLTVPTFWWFRVNLQWPNPYSCTTCYKWITVKCISWDGKGTFILPSKLQQPTRSDNSPSQVWLPVQVGWNDPQSWH